MNNLNEKQLEAVMHKEGPLLILAGAGSGKTSTMTHRIAHLIKDENVSPYSIFAVTFTNKAANEMKERVEKLVGNTNGMWLMTFHAACLRFLRMHADLIGYTKSFAVYDPQDQKTVIKNLLKEYKLDKGNAKKAPSYYLSVISDYKNKGLCAKDYEKGMSEFSPNAKNIFRVFKGYEDALKKNNAMDFDDLLVNAVKLFKENEQVLLKYQERFKYIMVDEYQDTNRIQYELISLLAEKYKNICVVGDDDQCIYEWRGADISNILDFEKDFEGAKVIKLEQNYRSTGNILEAAHSVVSKNKGRKDKKLWTTKDAGSKIFFREFDDGRSEASEIADMIREYVLNGGAYKDIAILYRTNVQSRTFEEAFMSSGISYRVLGGIKYYDRKEIKDMMSYMRLVANPFDDVSFVRIVNEPKRGMGEKTMDKIRALAMVNGESLFNTLCDENVLGSLPKKSYSKCKDLISCIKDYSSEKDNLRVLDIYNGLLNGTGYIESLEERGSVEDLSRVENLLEFKSVIEDMEEENENLSLEEFMEKLALLADIDNHNEDEDAVVLMTMHSAKGLEFPVVFMPGMEEDIFPGRNSTDKDKIEEERRLCYVGMTRAKEKLILTRAKYRVMYGNGDYTRISQFIKEIKGEYLDGDKVQEARPGNRFGSGGGFDGYVGEPALKPFDALKYSKAETVKSPKGEGIKLLKGDIVRHAKFGEGMVLEVDEKTVRISFEKAGVKKLAKNIAPIEKIEEKDD